jgi:Iap family predicted aminopeptidase
LFAQLLNGMVLTYDNEGHWYITNGDNIMGIAEATAYSMMITA